MYHIRNFIDTCFCSFIIGWHNWTDLHCWWTSVYIHNELSIESESTLNKCHCLIVCLLWLRVILITPVRKTFLLLLLSLWNFFWIYFNLVVNDLFLFIFIFLFFFFSSKLLSSYSCYRSFIYYLFFWLFSSVFNFPKDYYEFMSYFDSLKFYICFFFPIYLSFSLLFSTKTNHV